MIADRFIHGPGTGEAEWLACSALGAVPTIAAGALAPPGHRLVVCAPHPDDEILPCGGLLALLQHREILIIAITDGEASHPDEAARLRECRPSESTAALRTLHLDPTVHRCRFPDGGVDDAELDLTEALLDLIHPTDVILTPWHLDGHPDHEATTRAARIAARAAGAAPPIEMPIWGWHWVDPTLIALPWDRAVKVGIDDSTRAAKRQAIQAFTSQLVGENGTAPILPPHVLARFDRPWELFFR